MSTSCVIQVGSLTRQAAEISVKHTVNADQDTANSAAITVAELPVVTDVWGVQVVNTSGVHRNPQGIVSVSGNVVTIADFGLAVGEFIKFTAKGYTA